MIDLLKAYPKTGVGRNPVEDRFVASVGEFIIADSLPRLLKEIRACQICAPSLPHTPRPVLRARKSAQIAICGQAPGTRVHASGVPFTDPSGDRLRGWLGLDNETFYDERRVAIVPMGFCFPGLDSKGGDKPPRKECAEAWHARLFASLPDIKFKILIGAYAQKWHLKNTRKENVTETVLAWASYLPEAIPLPHPSWRNNGWLRKNPWFENELIPEVRALVHALL